MSTDILSNLSNYNWIPGFENRYKITPQGAVISFLYSHPRIIKSITCKRGYVLVNIYSKHQQNTTSKQKSVANLVLSTYGPPKPSPTHKVRYLDSNKQNTDISNLAWQSKSEIMSDILTRIKTTMNRRPKRKIIVIFPLEDGKTSTVIFESITSAKKVLKDNIYKFVDRPEIINKRGYKIFTEQGYKNYVNI